MMLLTNKIRDDSAIAKSSSWVLKEGLAVGVVIGLAYGGDVVVVAGIEYRVSEDEERNLVFMN